MFIGYTVQNVYTLLKTMLVGIPHDVVGIGCVASNNDYRNIVGQ
jgi:hypothetical protein